MRSRILSKAISAPSGLQCSHDSIKVSAFWRSSASIRTIDCCSGEGSKKSLAIVQLCFLIFPRPIADVLKHRWHRGQHLTPVLFLLGSDHPIEERDEVP